MATPYPERKRLVLDLNPKAPVLRLDTFNDEAVSGQALGEQPRDLLTARCRVVDGGVDKTVGTELEVGVHCHRLSAAKADSKPLPRLPGSYAGCGYALTERYAEKTVPCPPLTIDIANPERNKC